MEDRVVRVIQVVRRRVDRVFLFEIVIDRFVFVLILIEDERCRFVRRSRSLRRLGECGSGSVERGRGRPVIRGPRFRRTASFFRSAVLRSAFIRSHPVFFARFERAGGSRFVGAHGGFTLR